MLVQTKWKDLSTDINVIPVGYKNKLCYNVDELKALIVSLFLLFLAMENSLCSRVNGHENFFYNNQGS